MSATKGLGAADLPKNERTTAPRIYSIDEFAKKYETAKSESLQQEVPAQRFERTDLGNARRFKAKYGDSVRYCQALGWMVFTGTHWKRDTRNTVQGYAHDVADDLRDEAFRHRDDAERKEALKWASSSASRLKLAAMTEVYAGEPGATIDVEELDRDPELVNFRNGTLDLRRFELREHRREDLLTQCIPYDYKPGSDCPKFVAALSKLHPDPLVRQTLQQFFGYMLSGLTCEQKMLFFFGRKDNGKSFFEKVFMALTGDYSDVTPFSTFTAKYGNTSSHDIASLRGKRVVFANEAQAGQKWDMQRVKQVSSGEHLRAEFKYQNPFTFRSTAKVIFAANDKPTMPADDPASKKRFLFVHCRVSIPKAEQIPDYDKVLVAEEAEGILAWMVEGFRQWRENGGLYVAPAIQEYTMDSFDENPDVIGDFLHERCVPDAPARTPQAELYREFLDWFEGDKPPSSIKFGRSLEKRGFDRSKGKSGQLVDGIRLQEPVVDTNETITDAWEHRRESERGELF